MNERAELERLLREANAEAADLQARIENNDIADEEIESRALALAAKMDRIRELLGDDDADDLHSQLRDPGAE